jgi:hypothetical protein
MYRNVKNLWTEALRSGEYEQGIGRLSLNEPSGKVRYCCLGVLCQVAIKAGIPVNVQTVEDGWGTPTTFYDGSTASLPASVIEWAGLGSEDPWIGEHCASGWNDVYGATFNDIADLLDVHSKEL